ncbi:MAG TPA: tetratricopeptide repeat protein [Pyrinomonadaceae bacterium]|nr:tetratricopeptide repeat protein [Pyrinomonadaceae bacterium]
MKANTLAFRLLIFSSLLTAWCFVSTPNLAAQSSLQNPEHQANKLTADKAIAEAERLRSTGSAYSLWKAVDRYREALQIYRNAHDRSSEAATLNNIGLVYDSLGQRQKALDSFDQALLVLRNIADRSGEAVVLGNIGLVYSSLGDPEHALEFYNQALPILKAEGNHAGEASVLNNIGRIYDSLSNRQKALELYNQALALWKSGGSVAGEASTLTNIGSAYDALGEGEKALEYYRQALLLLKQTGDRSGEGTTLNNIGFLYFRKSDAEAALSYYSQALSLWRLLGDQEREATTLENIGNVYESLGDKQKAADLRAQILMLRKNRQAGRKPTLHILAIGIDHYPNGPRRTRPGMKYPLWNLTTCVKDARDLAASLATAANNGFEDVDTHLLVNSTRAEILEAFEKIIHEIKPQDTFIFSYSGQGLSASLNRTGKREFYLMPTDFNARVGLPGGISATLLRTLFTKIQAQRRLIILDARESSEGFDSLAASIAEENQSLAGLLQRDVALVTLSEGPRISLVEGEGRGNGLLTYALLKGIKQSAETGANGVTIKQLLEYARSYVKQRLPLIPNLDQYQRHVEVRSYFGGNDFPLVYEQTTETRRAHARASAFTPLRSGFGPGLQGTVQDEQPRRLGIEGRTDTALSRSPAIRKGKDFALLIAGNTYDQWPSLPNPVTDATAIEDELKNYYGFETKLVTNPTKAEIVAALKVYKNEVKYGDDDQLFIFIAGHGTYVDDFREGYIVAKNSLKDDPDASTYLSHSQLRNIIDQIPCKHIFLVIDACFGGTFDEKIARRGGPEEDGYAEVTNREFIYRKMQFETRQFLTSGGKEYVSDGRAGQHSPFARKFLEALRSYGGSSGILTITRILSYVERVTPEPRRGEWGGNEPGSDFIFVARQK